MNNIAVFRNQEDQKHFIEWWNAIKTNRALRAELRRTEGPEEVFLTKGFRSLYLELAGSYWIKEKNLPGLAAVAGITAYIETNEDRSFASACASGNDGPVISESRFSQLQKSRSLDELYIRMRRIIKQLGKKANVISVTDDILHWYTENIQDSKDSNPRNHILVRWGMDYFQNLNSKTNEK